MGNNAGKQCWVDTLGYQCLDAVLGSKTGSENGKGGKTGCEEWEPRLGNKSGRNTGERCWAAMQGRSSNNLDTWISRDARSTGSGGFFGHAFWPLGNAEEVSAPRAAAPLSTRWSEWSSPSETKPRPRGSRRAGVDLTREREIHRCPQAWAVTVFPTTQETLAMLKAGLLAASTSGVRGRRTGQRPRTGQHLVDAVASNHSTDSHHEARYRTSVSPVHSVSLLAGGWRTCTCKPSIGNVAEAPCSPCFMLTREICSHLQGVALRRGSR